MTTNAQLELGFNATQSRVYGRPSLRATRAQWWFAKMRDAVENAMDWQAAIPSRPEQIWMSGAHRQVKL